MGGFKSTSCALLNVLRVSGPAFTVEHQTGTEADWATCPDKEGQKRSEGPDGVSQEEKEEAAFTSKGASQFCHRNYTFKSPWVKMFHYDSCKSESNKAICRLCCCRFSASVMRYHWAYKTPSVTSALTVMLHSEPTTIYRGMSSFIQVWIVLNAFYKCLTFKLETMLSLNLYTEVHTYG